jgi:hypothetical protein
MHPGGIEVEVEMEIDVDVEPLGDREDALGLPVGIGVEVGSAADQFGAALAGGHEELLGAGIVDQPLLRKDADLQVDRPGVIGLRRRIASKPLRPMRGSTSTWVRMWVVPWTIARSSVRRARA